MSDSLIANGVVQVKSDQAPWPKSRDFVANRTPGRSVKKADNKRVREWQSHSLTVIAMRLIPHIYRRASFSQRAVPWKSLL
jgi:hypothetical protein